MLTSKPNCHFYPASNGLALIVAVLVSTYAPVSYATVHDQAFVQYVDDACNLVVSVPITPELIQLCTDGFPPDANGAPTSLLNLNSGAQSRGAGRAIEDRLEERKDEGGGSADDAGGWGLLLAPMNGTTERLGTDLENGFDSDMSGVVVGLDYLFAGTFVVGVAVASTSDEGDAKGGGGAFETESQSSTIYATWMASDYFSLDAYFGNADSDIDNQRSAVLGDINEAPRGATEGTQELSGISANFDASIGSWSVGAFIAMDRSETKIDSYTETGGSLLVLSYPEQTIESETETLGLRGGYAFSAGWGTLIPSVQYSMVDENKNDKRFIDTSLPFTPDYFFTVETDAPDREYDLQTMQLLAAFNGGNQLFLSYEKRSGHDFLEDSFVTAGAIFSF